MWDIKALAKINRDELICLTSKSHFSRKSSTSVTFTCHSDHKTALIPAELAAVTKLFVDVAPTSALPHNARFVVFSATYKETLRNQQEQGSKKTKI